MDRLTRIKKLLSLDERKDKERNQIPVRQPFDMIVWDHRKASNLLHDFQEMMLYLDGKGIFHKCQPITMNARSTGCLI